MTDSVLLEMLIESSACAEVLGKSSQFTVDVFSD